MSTVSKHTFVPVTGSINSPVGEVLKLKFEATSMTKVELRVYRVVKGVWTQVDSEWRLSAPFEYEIRTEEYIAGTYKLEFRPWIQNQYVNSEKKVIDLVLVGESQPVDPKPVDKPNFPPVPNPVSPMKLSICGMTVKNYNRSKSLVDSLKFYRNRTWVSVYEGQAFSEKDIIEGIAVWQLTGIAPIYCITYKGATESGCKSTMPAYVDAAIKHCKQKYPTMNAGYEIQNEPDLKEYYSWGVKSYVENYLIPTWQRVKDYGAQVIGGNFSWNLGQWDDRIPKNCNTIGGHLYPQSVAGFAAYDKLVNCAAGRPTIITEGGIGFGSRINRGEDEDIVFPEWRRDLPKAMTYAEQAGIGEWCVFIMTPSKKPGNNRWNISTNSPAALFDDDGTKRWGYDVILQWCQSR